MTKCVSEFPSFPQIYAYRSQAYLANNQFLESLEDAKHLLELLPNSGEAYYRIGAVYFAAEEFNQAEQAFKVGFQRDPQNRLCQEALENIKQNALKQYLSRIIAKARDAIENGELDLAISYYSDAITKNPGNHVYYIYRAVANMMARYEAEATEDAMKIVEISPKWPGVN